MPNAGLCRRRKQTADCALGNVPERLPSLLYDRGVRFAREFHFQSSNLGLRPLFLPEIEVQFIEVGSKFVYKPIKVLGLNPDAGCLIKMVTVLGEASNGPVEYVLHLRRALLEVRPPYFDLKMGGHVAELFMESRIVDDELFGQAAWQGARQFVTGFDWQANVFYEYALSGNAGPDVLEHPAVRLMHR